MQYVRSIKRKLFGPSYGIDVDGQTISRVSHIMTFFYLKPRDMYLRSKHVPLLMMFGEEHYVKHGCDPCAAMDCIHPGEMHLYEFLARHYASESHPIDVYVEFPWNYVVPEKKLRMMWMSHSSSSSSSAFSTTSSPFSSAYRGLLSSFPKLEQVAQTFPGRLRAHTNDVRLHYPRPIESEEVPFSADKQLDVPRLLEIVRSKIEDSDATPFRILRKQIGKQVLDAVDGRSLTSVDVWIEVYEMLLTFYTQHVFVNPQSIHLNHVISKLNSPFLDMYQLLRMFKKQCVDFRYDERECTEIYAPLAITLTGAQHSESLHYILTAKESPLCFYESVVNVQLPADLIGDKYCADLQSERVSISLRDDWIEWVENHREVKRVENVESVERHSFKSLKSKKIAKVKKNAKSAKKSKMCKRPRKRADSNKKMTRSRSKNIRSIKK
jgi:hypothetical protein